MSSYTKTKGGVAGGKEMGDASRYHDYFNIAVLPCLCAVNIVHLTSCYNGPAVDYEIDHFDFQLLPVRPAGDVTWDWCFWFFLIYLVVDFLWIVIKPESVAPLQLQIQVHHVVCIVGWLITKADPIWEPFLSASILQEISTVFLISKRHINAEHFPTLMGLWKALDHVTWIGIRVLLFPFGSYNIIKVFMYQSNQLVGQLPDGGSISDVGSLLSYISCYFHLGTFCTTLLFLMGAMNVFWTVNKYFKGEKKDKGDKKR